MRILLKKFFLGSAALILFSALLITTCKNPVGLGPRVELPVNAPVIHIDSDQGPGPGEFISGTKTIYVEATSELKMGPVTATIIYSIVDQDGKLVEQSPVTVDARWDDDAGCYAVDINTEDPKGDGIPMADGTLKIQIKAVDSKGEETITPELIYTVKNKKTLISMQIPKSRAVDPNDPSANPVINKVTDYKRFKLNNSDPYPEVVTGNFLMGIFEDTAGIEEGYPQIKFWKDGNPEPGTEGTDFRANAGWAGVSATSDRNGGDGWVYAENIDGDKAGSFRYYLSNRAIDGTYIVDGTETNIEIGIYHLKIRAADIEIKKGSIEEPTKKQIFTEWPEDAFLWDDDETETHYMTMNLIAGAALTPVLVEILEPDSEKMFFNEDFLIKARASVEADDDTSIVEMVFEVSGRNPAGERKQVILKIVDGSNRSIVEDDFTVELGRTYNSLETGSNASVTFVDGNYTFSIRARDSKGTTRTETLSLYIDTLPPEVNITGVTPNFSQDTPSAADNPNSFVPGYRRWTVNKSVKININSIDAWGNAEYEDTGYGKIKYLFVTDNDISNSDISSWLALPENNGKTFGDYLYAQPDAELLDEIRDNPVDVPAGSGPNGNPLIKVVYEGGTYTLTLQTHKYNLTEKYKLWLYIAAMDKTGNIGYTKILLNVDQETDKPTIESFNINEDGSSFIGENYRISLGFKDGHGFVANALEFRFATDDAEKDSLELSGLGWMAPDSILSQDGFTIGASDLSLIKIACQLLSHTVTGHTLDGEHKDALGYPLSDIKWIQIRASDDVSKKVYASDGTVETKSEWRKFTMDVTYPIIVPSETAIDGTSITRNADSPFIIPEKDGTYSNLDKLYVAYGDLVERNLESITIKIDGDAATTRKFVVPQSLETLASGEPAGDGFAVWKTVAVDWQGELRFRVPLQAENNNYFFDSLGEGVHTFEIAFEDRINQITNKFISFFKDTQGPEIVFITLGKKVILSNSDVTTIITGGAITPGSDLDTNNKDINDNNTITDDSGVLIGNFSDSLSPIAGVYEYKLDSGPYSTGVFAEGTWKPGENFDNTAGNRSVPWRIDITGLTDGCHRLSLKVKDSIGNESTVENISFKIELGVPVLTLTQAPGDFVTGNFQIQGKITEVGAPTLEVQIDNTALNSGISLTTISPTETNFTIDIDTSSLAETRHTITITAKTTGANPKSSPTETVTFTFDKTAPEVLYNLDKIYLSDTEMNAILTSAAAIDAIPGLRSKYNSLAGTSFRNSSAALAGNFSDALSEVYTAVNDGFWYKIDGIDGVDWFASTAWQWMTMPASTNRFVNWSIDLTGYADGIYRLSLRVKDAQGNGFSVQGGVSDDTSAGTAGFGFETNMAFRIDRGAPALTIDPIPEFTNSDLTVTGKIEGVFEVKTLSVRLDGVEVTTDVTLTRTEDTPGVFLPYSFDLSIVIPLVTGLYPEKPYSLIITATGASDQSETGMFSFTFDKTAPEISYNVESNYLSDAEAAAIVANNIGSITGLQAKYDNLIDSSFKDSGASLSGSFSDSLSAIFTSANNGYWYRIVGVDVTYDSAWQKLTVPASTNRFVNWSIPLANPPFDDGLYRVSLRVKDELGNGYDNTDNPAGNSGPGFVTNLAFMIARGIPVLSIDSEVPAFLNKGFDIEGQVTGVNAIKEFKVNLNGTELSAGNISYTLSSAKTFDYTITIPTSSLTQASNSVIITVTGASGQSAMDVRNFTYDNEAPDVSFISPSVGIRQYYGGLAEGLYDIFWSGTWVTGSTKISGTTDDKNGIEKIYFHLGKLDDDIAANDAARETIYNNAQWTDTRLDTDNPAANWSGGLYYWNYQENLNPYQFNSGTVEKGGTGLPAEISNSQSRFYLPLYVKIVDRAGNVRIAQYKIYVDPDMDIPQALINNPDENAPVGGEVRISGTANDNNWVHSVEIRIKPEKMPEDLVALPDYYKNAEDDWAYPNTFEPGTVTTDNEGWVKAKIQGSLDIVVGWYYNINADGLLTPPPLANSTRSVVIEVRSLDSKDIPTYTLPDLKGDIVTRTIYFDKGVPTIAPPLVKKAGVADRDYSDGIRVSGEFTFSTTVEDDGGISSIRARLTGSSAFTDIVVDGKLVSGLDSAWTITPGDPAAAGSTSDYRSYDISFVIDTTDTVKYPSLGYGKTGNFTIEFQVYDDKTPTPNNTNGTYSLAVDNFYPTTEISTQYNAATDKFYVSGTAADFDSQSGTIQGLERVLVYFEKNGTFYNSRGISPGQTDSFYSGAWATIPSMVNRPDVRDESLNPGGYGPNVPLFANFPVLQLMSKGGNIGDVWESPHAMVIDRQELGETTDTDEDGTFAEMWEGQVIKEWQARLNTKLFPDGILTVHYIVMDQAGNATHYKEDIYIGNNRPMIQEINLGTDVNGDGSVAGWISSTNTGEHLSHPFAIGDTESGNSLIPTDLRVRNNRLNFTVSSLYGNTDGTFAGNNGKHYKVSYVTRNGTPVNSTALTRGQVYTINVPGNTNWLRLGALNNYAGTTFVASGSAPAANDQGDATTGSAWTYTNSGQAGTQLTGNFSTHGVSTGDEVNTILFDNFDNILDSEKLTDGSISPANRNQRYFIVKVFDSTISGGTEEEQLAHVALLSLDIDNLDQMNPKIESAAFGKKFILNPGIPAEEAPNIADDDDKIIGDVGDYLENIVTTGAGNTLSKKGYVQYAEHSAGGTVSDVSGKIIFMGRASDNQRISQINATIPGYNGGSGVGTAFPIAVWNSSGLVPVAGHSIADMAVDGAGVDWGFEAVDQYLTLNYGHALNWRFAWDSSAVTGITAANINVTFTAYDASTGTPTTSNNLTSPARTVNIVPYISEVVTRLTGAFSTKPSAFNRSAQGWYPVGEDEVIEIKGFNFNGTSTDVTVNATSLSGVAVVNGNARTHISARVDDNGTDGDANNIVSGPLVVSVGGVNSINNNTNKNVEYNMEPNGLNNNILDNSRNLYVWNRGYINNTDVSTVYNPFMRMADNATRLQSYGLYTGSGNGSLIVRRNNTLYYAGTAGTNRMTNTTVATGVTNQSWYAAGSDITAGTYPFKFGRSTVTGTNVTARSNGTPAAIDIVATIGNNSDRFKIPRIAVQPTNGISDRTDDKADRILMSYFDENTKEVMIIYGNTGAGTNGANVNNISTTAMTAVTPANDATTSTQPHAGSMYTAVGFLRNGLPVIAWYDRLNQNLIFSYGSGSPGTLNCTAINNPNNAANRTFTFAAGHGFANGNIGYYSFNNGPLTYARVGGVATNNITFYDAATGTTRINPTNGSALATGDTLVFYFADDTYNSARSRVVTTTAQWQANAAIIDSFKGTHVDLAVDGNNNVHLAYYDVSNGGLYYALIPATGSDDDPRIRPDIDKNNVSATVTPVKVDTYLSAGTKIMINVRLENGNYVPYISYAHASFAETRNSVRVAWRSDFTNPGTPPAGTDASDAFTGAWEAMTVPVSSNVLPNSNEFICNGVPTSSAGWEPPGGTSTLRNYPTSAANNGTNINRTLLVGYMTDNWYEGAVLKHNLWTPSP